MKNIKVGGLHDCSSIVMGCMRIDEMPVKDVEQLMFTAALCNVNFFDHADIYGGGRSEEVFGKALKLHPELREKIILQTKCGIRGGYYDFSREHIIASVEGSLRRLQTDYVDILLLHRPDTLMEPEEVADAFDQLYSEGKVRHFGVSNQNPMQMELLKKHVRQPLLVNQLQLSVKVTGMIDSGFNVNMQNPPSVMHDGSVLEYCRLNGITIQAWSPFQYGFFEGVFLNHDKFPELNGCIDRIASEYGVTNSAVAIAWILRHPANMQVVTGTTNANRFTDICKGADITLTREQWYEIYRAAGNILP